MVPSLCFCFSVSTSPSNQFQVTVDVERLATELMLAWESEHEHVCASLDTAEARMLKEEEVLYKKRIKAVFKRHLAPYMVR